MKKQKQSNPDDDSFLSINEFELEKDCAGQPRLARKWNKHLAKAQNKLTEAEDNMELVEAEMGKKIRTAPKKFNIIKVTNDSVKEAIILSQEYQDAQKQVRDAQYAVGLIRASTIGLEHRKRMLEKMVDLFLADYFADPVIPKEAKNAVDELDKRTARRKGKRDRNAEDDD